MTTTPANFDQRNVIATYRTAVLSRDGMKNNPLRAEQDKTIQHLREIWIYWTGDDTLHETAFPDEVERPASSV
jgi:hypothetical protein